MATASYQSERARAVWRTCLASAFRTALACIIVGGITLHGPESIKRQVAFPAFSYVTVILVVTDANLGDTLRGCWYALYSTIQGVCPAILSLWLIGPARLTSCTTSALVAANAFLVVLPENTHLLSKRIALGQIVITYVIAFINGAKTEPVMHPIHVAASTAVGIFACVLALLLPYPSLACYEVKQNCKRFAENASERLKLFLKAFPAEDNASALAHMSQAKLLAGAGGKLVQSIKSKQESMQWEKIPCKFLKPYWKKPGDRLQEIETPLKGMEIALSSSSFPIAMLNPELKEHLEGLEEHISHQFKRIYLESATVREPKTYDVGSLQTLQTMPKSPNDLPSMFFLFCLKLLQKKSLLDSSTCTSNKGSHDASKNDEPFFRRMSNNLTFGITMKRFMPAFKSSLSLGLAVLLGLIYSKEDGFWSALPVALSLAAAREATFKAANIKAQGTVLGTVYGVLGCFIFEKYSQIRFISLLPWFIFCRFLRRSRMYGQAGGISAIVGAVLILGRKGFGAPSEFAIARIAETFIGLSCSIMVDLLFQPTRASTLAKIHLSKTFQMLHDCVCSISLCAGKFNSLGERQKQLKLSLNDLGKFVAEAEVEPSFWFVPFHSASYNKLLESLSMMTQFLLFGTQATRFLEQEYSGRIENDVCKEILNQLDDDIKLFNNMVCSSVKCLEEVSLIKSITLLDKELEKKKATFDIEKGKSPIPSLMRSSSSGDQVEIEKKLSAYLQHSKELIDNISVDDQGEKALKSQLVLSLSTVAFCMSSLARETREMEKAMKELLQWENPSNQVNLHEISCKIRVLESTVIERLSKIRFKDSETSDCP